MELSIDKQIQACDQKLLRFKVELYEVKKNYLVWHSKYMEIKEKVHSVELELELIKQGQLTMESTDDTERSY